MSDTAKLVKIGDGWYHQVAMKNLNLETGKHYCLKKTDKKNVLELVEADIQINGAGNIDFSGLLTKDEAELLYASKDEFETAHAETHYGIRGDYCAHYGIIKVYDKIASSVVNSARLTIHGGLTINAPGKDTLTTIASNITYTITGGEDCTIFLTENNSLREAQEVFYQTNEPELTKASGAWWNPKLKMWSFTNGGAWFSMKSAQPLVDAYLTNGSITRLSYAGYRLLDSQIPLTIDGTYPELMTKAQDIIGAINEVWDIADIAEAIADAAQIRAHEDLTTTNKTIIGSINEVHAGLKDKAGNADIIKINDKIGSVPLETTNQTVVGAINELNLVVGDVDEFKTLVNNLQPKVEATDAEFINLNNSVAAIEDDLTTNTADIKALKNSVGTVVMSTTNKTCTGAITEINNKIGTAKLVTQAQTLGGAINELAAAHDSNAIMHGMRPTVEDSAAEDLDTLRTEFNVLLALLRARGVID